MKKIAILFALILIDFISAAQSYTPFPDSNCVWSVVFTANERKFIKGDSIYNSLSYKKYYTTNDTSQNPAYMQLVALVRQDIPNKRIYGIKVNTTTEYLMYDFSVNVNDTLTVKSMDAYTFFGGHVSISLIDSILVNGYYRKRIVLQGTYGGTWEEWIEGIGSSFGPLSPGLADFSMTDVPVPGLLCQKVNGQLVYAPYNSCYSTHLGTSIKNETRADHLKLYPNPTNGIIHYGVMTPVRSVKIYSTRGEVVQSILLNKADQTIDLSETPSGIYMLRIITESGIISKKIVKE